MNKDLKEALEMIVRLRAGLQLAHYEDGLSDDRLGFGLRLFELSRRGGGLEGDVVRLDVLVRVEQKSLREHHLLGVAHGLAWAFVRSVNAVSEAQERQSLFRLVDVGEHALHVDGRAIAFLCVGFEIGLKVDAVARQYAN